MNSIRFAFAVNHEGVLQQKHFGDADKYLIYEWANNDMVFLNEINNAAKDYDEEQEHGSRKKGMAVSELLKNEGVKVLVSKQFGRNIRIVNNHFIPVIVYFEDPDESVPVFKKHIKWIVDELKNMPEEYKLFTIKEGVMKSIIKKEE
ncbi:MAG: hypothetical protein JXB00_12970 [Bacteroidales bacterium]|nr:hypothetical protein [Bacteroidales bacterium]